jgi:hypothetical protein
VPLERTWFAPTQAMNAISGELAASKRNRGVLPPGPSVPISGSAPLFRNERIWY